MSLQFFFSIAEVKNKNVEDKLLEKDETISNMLVKSKNEKKEKKTVNKLKYPKNGRIRVSQIKIYTFFYVN